MSPDETFAELEAVRRDILTIRHRMPLETPEWVELARERLQTFEEQERDLLRELADELDGE